MKCQHDDKSYAHFIVNDRPVKTPWICRSCGECGADEGVHNYTGDYAEKLLRFLERDGGYILSVTGAEDCLL